MTKLDLRGHRFERLTVIDAAGSDNRKLLWLCLCDCGTRTVVKAVRLRSGHTKSCGCLHVERASERGRANTTHGKATSPVYRTWLNIKRRCENPRSTGYENYGGRGIAVCERWQTFQNFLADMGEPPAGMSIDRIDVHGHYEPANCRWATATEQSRNARSNRSLTFRGRTLCVSEWAEVLGVSPYLIFGRLRLGWPVDRALTEPSRFCVPRQIPQRNGDLA